MVDGIEANDSDSIARQVNMYYTEKRRTRYETRYGGKQKHRTRYETRYGGRGIRRYKGRR